MLLPLLLLLVVVLLLSNPPPDTDSVPVRTKLRPVSSCALLCAHCGVT
jgi:hypothetical protein